jgi:hypothetical protein
MVFAGCTLPRFLDSIAHLRPVGEEVQAQTITLNRQQRDILHLFDPVLM